jgi:hypothetical protein
MIDILVLILYPRERPLQITDPIPQLGALGGRADDLVVELLDLEVDVRELILLVFDVGFERVEFFIELGERGQL